ncbi:MAG: FkbM family methyltransferase [Candidatus Paceibacterota bacterium]|jgi:FkbM family methyltransferase
MINKSRTTVNYVDIPSIQDISGRIITTMNEKLPIIPNSVTVKTLYGLLSVDPKRDAKIASRLLDKESYHQHQALLLIKKFINENSVVIDAGAHIGTFSIPLSKWAKKVVSFEPSPDTFKYLEHNSLINDIKNVEAKKLGLGSAPGRASLGEVQPGNAGSQMLQDRPGDIVISTIDAETNEADLIKIDVEGMEPAVLGGAKKTFTSNQPVVFLEVNLYALRKHDFSQRDIAKFFKSIGYRMYCCLEIGDRIVLGKILNTSLLTCLISPRAFFLGGPSLSFDIMASPHNYKMPESVEIFSPLKTIYFLIKQKIGQKLGKN